MSDAAAAEASRPTTETKTNADGTVATKTGKSPTMVSVFVGDLDATVGEDQLLDTFRSCGPIISVRVCRDIITRKSLGYGYVNFQNHSDAEKAITAMNFTSIAGRRVRLMWQQRDPALRISGQGNLFVRNLDASTDHKTLVELFSAHGQIMSAKVMTDSDGKCRGYGFVHYKDEGSADKALQSMNGKEIEGWSNPLYVANFIRRNARIAMLVQNFTNVYIKHLLPNATVPEIENFFSKFGGITSTVTKHDTKGRTFAFCNFKNHEDAVKAIEDLNDQDVTGLTPGGEKLFVARAQNRAERLIELRQKYIQRQSRGNNLYVRNFDPEFTDENLRDLFKGFGDVKSCKVMNDEKGHPRGFGFVSFSSAEEANHALREMNGRMLNGKPLVVNIAQRRDHRMSMLQVQFHQRLQSLMQAPIAPMFYAAHKGFLSGASAAGGMPMPTSMPAAFGALAAAASGAGMSRGMAGPSGSGAAPSKQASKRRGGGGGRQQQHQKEHQQQQASSSSANAAAAPAAAATTAPSEDALPSLSDLMKMSADDRKRTLGERLFPAVLQAEVPEELTPKITGMLLELDPADGLALLTDGEKLKEKINEALCVLK